jgi:hypothetical protein
MRDEFLSEEDLDLRDLDEKELLAHWDHWLLQAQATNDVDEHLYSHGVFQTEPESAARRDESHVRRRVGDS